MKNIEALRADTPGCKHKIHFNNAGASLMPMPVIQAVTDYHALEAITGGYETSDLKAREINGFYESMSRLLNTSPSNIAFTSSATSSFARALSCIPFVTGDSVLIAQEDYISNQLAFLSLQKRFGIHLLRADSLAEGGVDLDSMKKLMDKHHPKLVSLTHIPTNSGLVQPVEAVGAMCKERNIQYLVDACQSVGQLPIDVKKIQCDFLSGTFRKFLRGPRGTGFLYVSDSVLKQNMEPLFLDMRGGDWISKDAYQLRPDARRFEDWEIPYGLLVGCKASANYALSVGLEEIRKRNEFLCDRVRKELARLNLSTLDYGKVISSIITVNIPNKAPADVLRLLRERNVNTSIAHRSSAVIDFDAKGVTWALRISPHYYNSEKDVEFLSEALKEVID